MAEASAGQAPLFRLQKMYVKDLSFENPNAPASFQERSRPEASVNLSVRNRKVDPEHWEVTVEVHAHLKAEGRTVFLLEVEHAGLFLLRNIPEEHLGAVLGVDCPTVLFPFTRQVVSQAAVDGGFPPFLLEPVSFLAMYQSARKSSDTASEETQKH